VRRARFAVLRDAPLPAVLIEAGCLSHPAEGKKILDTAYRREIAKAIAEGVLAYRRVVER
jgi:N-acetylmuramoyl-L-alanine amidase